MNKCLVFLFVSLILNACSPKVVTTKVPQKDKPIEPKVEKPATRFTEAEISLLIPFKLNQFNPATATKTQLSKSDMAIDFYQGVMMGIDSAANYGLNYTVNVFDTKEDNLQLANLFKNANFKTSDLLIGPVFPESIKFASNFAMTNNLIMVSPLAASKPNEFNNPKLVSIVNNIDQHGQKIADYIAGHYNSNSAIVVLINPQKANDEEFAAPIRNRLKNKYPQFIVQEFAAVSAFETKMIKGKQYLVVLCSDEPSFVTPNLAKLYRLKNLKTGPYAISLIGHPNWSKQHYNVAQLQDLKTIISTSYWIDYKNQAVINFVKKYRINYNYEPSEYSFKGFDIGFYFAKLLAKYGSDYLRHLTKEPYKGLHNSFNFTYDAKTGYANTDLLLLQYKNLSLIPIK